MSPLISTMVKVAVVMPSIMVVMVLPMLPGSGLESGLVHHPTAAAAPWVQPPCRTNELSVLGDTTDWLKRCLSV
ncbi:MAG: hypothetical protein AAGA95_14690 [Pseudomonadota bacterium]